MFHSELPNLPELPTRILLLGRRARAGRLFLATLALGLGMATARPCPAEAQGAPTLDAGAKIHVTMAGAPDLTGDYTVDAAGDIQMLYVNQVHVGGLTPEKAGALLASTDCLGRIYKSPQIVVMLLSPGGLSVEVTGAVTTQGMSQVRSDARLNDVLQRAALQVDAQVDRVQITHGGPNQPHSTDTVNYLAFLNSQDSAGNPPLQDSDVIFVPHKEAPALQVSVRGQVAKPGRAEVAAKTTVYDALQAAGGVLVDADRSAISVQHADAADPTPFDYDQAARRPNDATVNPVLRDGDTITVSAAAVPNTYTITGAVRSPAEYPLTRTGFTLADAIGKAGGLADRAKLKEVTIIRRTRANAGVPIKMDASDLAVQAVTVIQPGDDIVIPQGGARPHHDPLSVLGSVFGVMRIFGL